MPPRILVVDDEEMLRDLFRDAILKLVDGPIEVQVVSSGQEALEVFSQATGNGSGFTAVITDYNMPGMTGLELAQKLWEITQELPIALVSGNHEELKGIADSCIRFKLFKPFKLHELRSCLQSLLLS